MIANKISGYPQHIYNRAIQTITVQFYHKALNTLYLSIFFPTLLSQLHPPLCARRFGIENKNNKKQYLPAKEKHLIFKNQLPTHPVQVIKQEIKPDLLHIFIYLLKIVMFNWFADSYLPNIYTCSSTDKMYSIGPMLPSVNGKSVNVLIIISFLS